MRYLYEALFEPNELGGYDVVFPDIDIVTSGESLDDAAAMAYDALRETAISRLARGKDMPQGTFGHAVSEEGIAIGFMVDVSGDEPDYPTMGRATARSHA